MLNGVADELANLGLKRNNNQYQLIKLDGMYLIEKRVKY